MKRGANTSHKIYLKFARAGDIGAEREKIMKSLTAIDSAKSDADYEHILKGLADWFLNKTMLEELDRREKTGSIYDCDGPFVFVLDDDDEEDDYDEDLD